MPPIEAPANMWTDGSAHAQLIGLLRNALPPYDGTTQNKKRLKGRVTPSSLNLKKKYTAADFIGIAFADPEIHVYLRKDDLYVIGWKVYRVTKKEPRFILGVIIERGVEVKKDIGFQAAPKDIFNDGRIGPHRVCYPSTRLTYEEKHKTMKLGRKVLKNALETLSAYEPGDDLNNARPLSDGQRTAVAAIALSIAEATRFRFISNELDELWGTGNAKALTSVSRALLNLWEKAVRHLFCKHTEGDDLLTILPPPERVYLTLDNKYQDVDGKRENTEIVAAFYGKMKEKAETKKCEDMKD